MAEFELKVNGLACGACEKIVERAVHKTAGNARIESFDFTRSLVRVSCNHEELRKIKAALAEKGFHAREWMDEEVASEGPVAILSALLRGEEKFAFERQLGIAAAFALAASLVLDLFLAAAVPTKAVQGLLPLMALGSIGIALGLGALGHIRPYGRQTCQTGMMLGMGAGMMLGFLVGALFGASSGMFMGSLLGMGVGMALGAWIGLCCGAMGVLEGLMGGLMAGTMGAMLSVMLYNDHQLEFLVLLWIVCGVILLMLSYMLFKENGPAPESAQVNPWMFLALSVALTLAVDLLLVFGPKSTFAWGA